MSRAERSANLFAALTEAATFAAVLLAMLWLVPYSESGAEADRALALRLPVLMALVAWLGRAVFRRAEPKPGAPPLPGARFFVALALAWLGWTAIAAAAAPDPQTAFFGAPPRLQGWATLALGPLLALAWLRAAVDGTAARRLSLAPRLGGAAVALYALLQAAGLDPLVWQGIEALRPGATQGNPVFLGALLVLAAPFALAAAIDESARGRRGAALVSLGCWALEVAAVTVVGARAASVALVVGAAVQAIALLAARGAPRLARRALAALALGAALLAGLGYSGRLPGFDPATGTARQRWLLWTATVDLLASEPARLATGYGPDGLALALPRHLPEELPEKVWAPGRYQDRAHNFELDVVATLGLPGLALALLLFVAAAAPPLRRLALLGGGGDPPERSPSAALDGALVAALAGHLVELQLGFRTVGSDLLFWCVAALALVPAGHPRDAPARAPWPPRALGRALALGPLPLAFATWVPAQGAESRIAQAALLLALVSALFAAVGALESGLGLGRFARRELPAAALLAGGFFVLHAALLARAASHVTLLGVALAALLVTTVALARALAADVARGSSLLLVAAALAAALAFPLVARPLAAGIHWRLAATDLAAGRPAPATAQLARAVELAPGWTALRLDLARARVRAAAGLDAGAQRGALAEVARDLSAWRARRPLDPAIDEELALVEARRARLEPPGEARVWLERALERQRSVVARLPASGAAQRNLGALLLDLGDLPAALARLEAATRLAPRSLEGQLLYARALLEAREVARAESAVDAALALDADRSLTLLAALARAEPRHLEAQLLVALAAARAERGDLALAALATASRLAPPADGPLLERIRRRALAAGAGGR